MEKVKCEVEISFEVEVESAKELREEALRCERLFLDREELRVQTLTGDLPDDDPDWPEIPEGGIIEEYWLDDER